MLYRRISISVTLHLLRRRCFRGEAGRVVIGSMIFDDLSNLRMSRNAAEGVFAAADGRGAGDVSGRRARCNRSGQVTLAIATLFLATPPRRFIVCDGEPCGDR